MVKSIFRTFVVGIMFVLVASVGVDRASAQSLSSAQMNALQAAVAANDMAAIQSLTAQIVGADPSLHTAVGAALGGFVGSVPGAATNAEAIAEAMGKGVVQGSIAGGESDTSIATHVRAAVKAMVLAAPPASKVAIARGAVTGATEQADASGISGLTDIVGSQAAAGAIEAAIDDGLTAAQIGEITRAATAAAAGAGASPQAVAVAALQAGADPNAVAQGLADAGVPNPGEVVTAAQNQIQNIQRTIGNEREENTSAS